MLNLNTHCLRILGLLFGCSLLMACGYDLRDDVDLTLDFTPLIGPSDSLHSPYVKGSRFNVFLDEQGSIHHIAPGWRVDSADPAVVAISNVQITEYESDGKKHSYLQAAVAALGEGQTAIIVRSDDGSEVFRSAVEVLRPDRIELLAHGPLLIERPAGQAVTTAVQVLTGGTATFLARYYRGDRQLFGNGTLSVVVPSADPFTAEVRRTFLFEDRDWLAITAQREGVTQLGLLAAGEPISQVTVTGVGEAALAQVQLSQADRVASGHGKDGEQEVVLAETADRAGQPIYGVTFNWSYGGTAQTGLGDLYRYEFQRGMHRMLSAQHGAMATELMIEGKQGHVDSTNHIGCAMATRSGGGSSGVVAAALLGCALGLFRRRRAGMRNPTDYRAYRRGSRSRELLSVPYEKLWERPVAELAELLCAPA